MRFIKKNAPAVKKTPSWINFPKCHQHLICYLYSKLFEWKWKKSPPFFVKFRKCKTQLSNLVWCKFKSFNVNSLFVCILNVFVIVRHKKKLQCHALFCRTDADAKTLADCCRSQMTKQRQQASTPQKAPKRRLDVREDECANLTPKGFVLIDAILGLLTACFSKWISPIALVVTLT